MLCFDYIEREYAIELIKYNSKIDMLIACLRNISYYYRCRKQLC